MTTSPDHVDFHALLDSIPEFIVVKDAVGRWLFCNKTALAAYELSGLDYLGITDAELIELRPQFAESFRHNIASDALAWSNRAPTVTEKSFTGENGRHNTWEVIKTPSFHPDGTRFRLMIVSRNITERKLVERALQASEERFKHLAHIDGLTGVPNRRGILDLISLELSRRQQTCESSQCALIYLDLDHFKRINDELGHESGDELLIAFAGRTLGCLRSDDLFGRIGGDEFVVFLTSVERSLAVAIAERLCDELGKPWKLQDRTVVTSSSIGIAFYPDAGTEVHTLLRHADEALYQAKRAGRSQVAIYRPEG